MKRLTRDQISTLATLRAASGHSRRTILKGAAAAGAVAAMGPWIVKDALSSSGQVNFMGWSGYDFKEPFAALTAQTGIKMNFLDQPDQDSMFAQCKLSLQTGAVDVVEPTLDREPEHRDHCLSKAERASNRVICCCVSRSRTPVLVLDL